MEVLPGRWLFLELEQAGDAFSEDFANLSGPDEEERTPLVDQVYPPVSENSVGLAFKGDGVVAKEQSVRVERDRHRGFAECLDPFAWLEATGRADLDHSRSE